MLSELSQTEKDKYCTISLIYGILKMLQMSVYAKQEQIHRYRKQTSGYQRGERREEGKLGVWD